MEDAVRKAAEELRKKQDDSLQGIYICLHPLLTFSCRQCSV